MSASNCQRALGVCLLLLSAYAAAFPQVFLGSQTFFCRDYGSYSYPVAVYAKNALLHGSLPLWNPYSLNGIPFFAQWSPMVLYPPTLIYLILPTWYGLPLFMFVHLALGGVGMWQLLLNLTGKSQPAALAGFSFGFSGLPLSLLCWPAHCAAYGLAPWVILAMLWMAENPDSRRLAVAALATALQLFTGSPEIIATTWVIALGLTIAESGRDSALHVLLAWCLAIGLAAIQLLPFLSLLLNSNRLTEASLDWSLQPRNLLNFVAPAFHVETTPYGFAFPENQKWLTSYYIPFGLTAMLFTTQKTVWRNRIFLISIILAGIGLILAMSPSLPFVAKALAMTPVGIVRYPIKYLLLTFVTLHLAIGIVLAEDGVRIKPLIWAGLTIAIILVADSQFHALPNFCVRWLLGITICFLIGLSTISYSGWPALGAVFIMAVDVLTHATFYPTIDTKEFLKDRFLAEAQNLHEAVPALGASRIQRMEVERVNKVIAADHRARMELLSRNRSLLDQIPSAGGFYSMYLKNPAELTTNLYAYENFCGTNFSYLDFIGISICKGPDGHLQRRSGAKPMLTAGQAPVASTNQTRATLTADLTHEVVLTESCGLAADSTATISGVLVSPHRIRALATAHTNTVLVIAQSYYPAWRATVNGKETRVLRADAAFQAVPLPAGTSTVELFYDDEKLHVGMICSGATFILLLVMLRPPRINRSR
jgi:hypothetical protein